MERSIGWESDSWGSTLYHVYFQPAARSASLGKCQPLRCSAFLSRKWGVWIIWGQPFLPMSQGDQETKKQRNLDMSKLIHRRFFKNYSQPSKGGDGNMQGLFSNHTLYRKTDISISFLPPWNTCKERSYDECVLHINSADKKNQKWG